MSRKIGFWSVFALVTGSQIGSAVFMLPANLAPYGILGLMGWAISGVGAVALALVFGKLCSWLPRTGGPHVYVNKAFGPHFAFFTGWTYWVISWVSTPVVIVASIGYLTPLIGVHSSSFNLSLEIGLIFIITLLNLQGVKAAGRAEFFLTLLKIIPLIVMPIMAFFIFNKDCFLTELPVSSNSISHSLSAVTLLTLWAFIGVESATTPAGSVENPSKTIPKAIVLGTICVAILYFFNSLSIMGVVPGSELMNSPAPYADAAQRIFGGNWHLIISVMASIVCIGTLNAWVLASGQISSGLAQDGLLPGFFAKKNKKEAPYYSLFMSFFGIVPLLILTSQENLARQMNMILDFSVTAFVFVYLICCFAFFKLLPSHQKRTFFVYVYGGVALLFCVWILYETPLKTLLISGAFTVTGIPLFLWRYRHIKGCGLEKE
ncbi:MAG: amino acid permease [Alphaproteobacteria bacterium 16-39-46]|nr:MAG: amino acid permease [Alphaproteobacteria bacterium 16-39-46]OZA43285.1 MAG: amino acid permease [Alphaproteobacteria bacterium 17-39-52]HQS84063.1 amino acid permease [Alphaproteobacteria bacterium]HQS93925.1 amino acid permease [Alphaproteobacteria bacterium]